MDTRTKLEKLRAMAAQTTSPYEAEAARLIVARIERDMAAGKSIDLAYAEAHDRLTAAAEAFAGGLERGLRDVGPAIDRLREMLNNPPTPAAEGRINRRIQ